MFLRRRNEQRKVFRLDRLSQSALGQDKHDRPVEVDDRWEMITSALGRWRRRVPVLGILKWTGISFLSLLLIIHMYAMALALMLPPTTANMIGSRLVGAEVTRTSIPLERISPNLVQAVIAAEDSRFCEHGGVDFDAIQQALAERRAGGRLRGASTISQQTAKNVFLWNGGGFARKGAEAWMTLVGEQIWGKARTMEIYLNVAEWGDGIYGAEAAAQARFGKSAQDLTSREAALLAAVLPSPNNWRLDPPTSYVSGRANTIQQRMAIVRRDGLASCVLD